MKQVTSDSPARRGRRWRTVALPPAATIALVLGVVVGAPVPATGSTLKFVLPQSIVASGGYVWVENAAAPAFLTQISASTGQVVRVVKGASYDFNTLRGVSAAMIAVGPDLWIANQASPGEGTSGSLTEVNATTGALVRVVKGGRYHFSNPQSLALYGSDLWVANASSGLTEINSATGALVRVVSYARSSPGPAGLAITGSHLWVSFDSVGQFDERNAATGALIRHKVLVAPQLATQNGIATATLVASGAHVWQPGNRGAQGFLVAVDASMGRSNAEIPFSSDSFITKIAAGSGHLWALVPGVNAVTELSGSTGHVIATIGAAADDFQSPVAVTAANSHVWVLSESTLTELNATTGALIQVVGTPCRLPGASACSQG